MNTFWNYLQSLLGLAVEPKDLSFIQMSLRGVVIFAATLMMVRLSSKRSLAEKTAFEAVLLVVIASVLARGINGSAAFFPTIGTGIVLVVLHWFLGLAAYHSHQIGILLKGEPAVIVQNGQLDRASMRRNHISTHDLEEDLRLNASTEDLSKIKTARVERSGDISFIKSD
jgi:uncharacterized membrane protein YcaP (DUF421 family)